MEPIGDYAVIGDCRSAALVSKRGSMDWLCWPRFDSPSIFDALLSEDGGRWRLCPVGEFQSERRYREGTNVLETAFSQGASRLVLTDFMPVSSEEDKRYLLSADHEILRVARCEQGEIELEMLFEPRPDYGRRPAAIRRSRLAFRTETGQGLLALRSEMPLDTDGVRARGRARLRAGQVLCSSLTFADEALAVFPPLGSWTSAAAARSEDWWRGWLSRLRYDGPHRPAVERSALALKLLVYAPSGAIVAAPTTSLPERLGGDLNWDYRFCWLRDASLTARALIGLGFVEEAQAFVYWLIHSTALSRPELRVLYDVFGRTPGRERTLDHLPGYMRSRPVRVGNAAQGQFQLDLYGEVIHAAFELASTGESFDRESQAMLRDFGELIMRRWSEPDEGLWEPRSGRARHTHSRLLCWAGVDRLIDLHGRGLARAGSIDGLFECRRLIRDDLEQGAWNPALGSYAATLGGSELDSSLLLIPWYGFEKPDSARMKSTFERLRERLSVRGALFYRNLVDAPDEGAFGACGFWAAEYLALGGGTPAEAERAFERLLAYSNDLGLYGEETDPASGQVLGNFPQAFTHIGLINAALSLSKRLKGERPAGRRGAAA